MKKIKISDIGKFSEDQFEKLLKFAVLELDSRLKQASPVDTGRFRGNWTISENSRNAPFVLGPFQNNKSISRSALPAIKNNYQKEKAGNVYSLINPLPYAEAITYGTNLPPSWGNQFRTKDSNRKAGWPDAQVRAVANLVQKAKIKER
tara:strand:- start:773 stop:1216 length:444 start_codon:yes stop_codon:yes gene_type:complete